MGLVEIQSERGQEYEAKHSLELAYTLFPSHPQDDPHYAYTHFKMPQLSEARMYLNLQQAKQAREILEKLDDAVQMGNVPDRIEFLPYQTKAALLLGDMQRSFTSMEQAILSATALGSALRLSEAALCYKHMLTLWPNEQDVKSLAEYFQK